MNKKIISTVTALGLVASIFVPTASAIHIVPSASLVGKTLQVGEYNGMQMAYKVGGVKDVDGDGIDEYFLVSQNGIEVKEYDEFGIYDESGNADWTSSSLRIWLNSEFYEEAFSPEEKAHIVTVTNKSYYSGASTSGSAASLDDNYAAMNYDNGAYRESDDTIFIPSMQDIKDYGAQSQFPASLPEVHNNTDYTKAATKEVWLRDTLSDKALVTKTNGSETFFVYPRTTDQVELVQPCFWLKLDKNYVITGQDAAPTYESTKYNVWLTPMLHIRWDVENQTNNWSSAYTVTPVRESSKVNKWIQLNGIEYYIAGERANDKGTYDYFITSRYLLKDANNADVKMAFSAANSSIWEDSDLRAYLNGEFYSDFSDAERSIILPTETKSSLPWVASALARKDGGVQYQGYSTTQDAAASNQGLAVYNTTEDYVFAPSLTEFNQYIYFGWFQGQYCLYKMSSHYWLRDAGTSSANNPRFVQTDGTVGLVGSGAKNSTAVGVRPCMWINLDDAALMKNGSVDNPYQVVDVLTTDDIGADYDDNTNTETVTDYIANGDEDDANVWLFVAGFDEDGRMVECHTANKTIAHGSDKVILTYTPSKNVKYYAYSLDGDFAPIFSRKSFTIPFLTED